MKTAEEWLESEQWHETGDKDIVEQLKKVQLDAWKQGMSDAAILVEKSTDDITKIPLNIKHTRDARIM